MLVSDEEQLIVKNTVAINLLEVVGQGIDFPFRFTYSGQVGTIEQSNAGERIKDSIHLILATRSGERPFNPEFGSRLQELVFEPNDEILQRLLSFYTAEALKRWEKRIELVQISIMDNLEDQSTVGIHIEYTIRNSHILGSYVYPFVREGMVTGDLYTGVEAHRMLHPGSIRE